jgi:hypothetical protein
MSCHVGPTQLAIPRQVGSLSRAQADALSLASKRPATPALQQPEVSSNTRKPGHIHVLSSPAVIKEVHRPEAPCPFVSVK